MSQKISNLRNKHMNTTYIDHYENKDSRWCSKHVTGFWGKSPITGTYYKRCSVGNKRDEDCEIGELDKEE